MRPLHLAFVSACLLAAMPVTLAAAKEPLATAAPASAPDAAADNTNDPWEGFNRHIFDFNLFFDRNIVKPVTSVYHELPSFVRHSVSNVLTNLSEPLNVVHGVLQLNPNVAFTSFWRFVLNSTVGFAGIRDFAGEQHLYNMDQNLGKTMGRWGVGTGPYVVLPVLGPSSARDTTGRVGDWFLDPVDWALTTPESIAEGVVDGISTRDSKSGTINYLYYQSLDPYIATRSAWQQHEAYEITKEMKKGE